MRYRRQIWDSVARDYDVIWEVADYTPILRSLARGAGIGLGKRVLAVATGTGAVSIEAGKRVGEHGLVVGIDLSRPMLEQAMNKKKVLNIDNADFILADAHNLPLINGCFDAATSCFAFAFLSDPQKAANEMARVLKTGGSLASVEWERPPVHFWAETRKKGGIRDFLESELTGILCNSGFTRIRTERIKVLHRRANVSEEQAKKSELLSVRLMGLEESDANWFFPKIREEYRKLPHEKRGWLPIMYVGVKH
jgi:ubiquinone/menaquinone biosynthesis C-methylase UbiE